MGGVVCRYDEVTLPPEPWAAGVARAWVADRLAEWELAGPAHDLRLVVSELVTNAVLHARTKIEVSLAVAEDVIELSVRDHHPRLPRPRRQWSGDAATGRGLMLVEALSDDWGVADRMDGKEVWLRVGVPRGWRYTGGCGCAEEPVADVRRVGSGRRVVVNR